MITVGMNYEVIEGKQGEFETMFAKVLGVMEEMAGHDESHLFVNVSKRNSYLIVSQWADEKAFDGFIASDRFKNVTKWGKEKILASRPQHEIYGREKTESPPSSCPAH